MSQATPLPVPARHKQPLVRHRSRKGTQAAFGSVRKLPSGRYQARYSDSRMDRHTARQTFATKKQAEDWLATVRADMVRGTWRAPELGTGTLAEYASDHLARGILRSEKPP